MGNERDLPILTPLKPILTHTDVTFEDNRLSDWPKIGKNEFSWVNNGKIEKNIVRPILWSINNFGKLIFGGV